MMAFLAVPAAATTMVWEERGVAEMIDEPIAMTIDGNAVTISGAQGLKLIVVSLTGRQIAEYRIDSPAQRIELNLTKGCYVLKVGNVVRKVSIR
ncbi:MAG: T9SS type A sorting domain-containing protein [Prevotella sp.]|nr:T9SS type A sorting domain-containing protein [Prevotella sp.]MBO7539078.1 T9SS type A sorting domain-containing protein [Prevotella sp.]